MTVGRRKRRVAVPAPDDPTKAWSWSAIMSALDQVQKDPPAAIERAQARGAVGSRFAPDAELELFLDMPDTRLHGRAGPPKHPELVTIPPIPSIEHDDAYFELLEKAPIPAGVLDPLRGWFRR
jgi:hypothetical protein